VRVKVSGLTTLEDARLCAGLGADYLGFVQTPGDARYIAPEGVREILTWVVGPEPVGIFEDAPLDTVLSACRAAGFRHVRLDGHEPPTTGRALREAGLAVIRTVRVHHDASAEQVRALLAPHAEAFDYACLDVGGTSLLGGPGESLSWRIVRALAEEVPLFLAGPLTAANVAEAMRMRPFALDLSAPGEVADGETTGLLDFEALGAFFDAFRAAAADG